LDLTNQETINEDQLQGKELYFQWCPRLAVLSPIGGISDDTYVVFGEQLVGFGASFFSAGFSSACSQRGEDARHNS
jgi:hypothetical protein